MENLNKENEFILDDNLSEEETNMINELNKEFEEQISRFKEIDSIDNISSKKDVEIKEGEFKINFEDLCETGRIGEHDYMFFDYNTSNFIVYNSEFEIIMNMKEVQAKHFLIEKFKENGIKLKNPGQDLLNIKKVFSEFVLSSDNRFLKGNFGTVFNTFNIKQTKLLEIKKMRTETIMSSNFKFKDNIETIKDLEQSCPYFYSLLLNLFENNVFYIDHFINQLSFFVNERKKIRTATVFSGIQGSGKGVFIDFLSKIFSKEYTSESLASSLKSEFNTNLKNKLIVNFNEFSSDFSKNDVMTQKLKSLITDNTFLFNDKHQSAYEMNNYFMTFLSQNDKNSIKISQDDRRFNYFIQTKTLKEMVADKFKIGIESFLERLYGEVDNLCYILAIYDYNEYKVNTLIETEHKRYVQNATSNGIDILCKVIKDRNIERIEAEIEDQYDLFLNAESKNKYSDNVKDFMQMRNIFLNDIKNELKKDVLSNKSLTFLYQIFVGNVDEKDDKSLNKIFSQNFGESKVKSINGKSVRVRILEEAGNKEDENMF